MVHQYEGYVRIRCTGRREVAWLIPKGTRDRVLAAFGLDIVKVVLDKGRIDPTYIVT